MRGNPPYPPFPKGGDLLQQTPPPLKKGGKGDFLSAPLYQKITIIILLTFATCNIARADPQWQSYDELNPRDRAIVISTAMPMFGTRSEDFPAWLDLKAVIIPTRSRDIMVVRIPWQAACGAWGYVIFGQVASNGTREQLGGSFCGSTLAIIRTDWRELPDLLVSGGKIWSDSAGRWLRKDQQLRWLDGRWVVP